MSSGLDAELLALRKLTRQQLKDTWRDLYRAAPPAAFTPDLVARGIASRLQERALGGITSDMHQLVAASGRGESKPRQGRPALKAGNRLVRRWRGRTYVIEAVLGGFSYQGEQFRSLSEIARKITGTRWSGPKFFGLVA